MDFVGAGMIFFLIIIGIRALNHTLPHISSFARNKVATILIIFIGTGLMYITSVTEVRAMDIGKWGQNHLLQIFLCWGMIAGTIALSRVSNAKTLQWIMAGIVAMITVVIPLGIQMTSPPKTGQENNSVTRSKIVLTIAPRTEWNKLIVPPHEKSEHISVPVGMRIRISGDKDNFDVGNIYVDGHTCSKDCQDAAVITSYAINNTDEEIKLIYAFEFIKNT